MTPEEARARVEADKAELKALKRKVQELGQQHRAVVFFAMFECLVEMMCAAQGAVFADLNKRRFYSGVLGYLATMKGIR